MEKEDIINTSYYREWVPRLILRSRRYHGSFFDFFRPYPSIAISGVFQWHQLS
jgi:hypothetical protein